MYKRQELYDAESGDADADLWTEEIVERTPAIVEGGAGGEDIIDEEYVPDVHVVPFFRGSVRRCVVKDFGVMKTPAKLPAYRKRTADIECLFLDVEFCLSRCASPPLQNIRSQTRPERLCHFRSNNLRLIVPSP